MVFGLIAEIAAEVSMFAFSMFSEVSGGLAGGNSLPSMISANNRAQENEINDTHRKYQDAANQQKRQEQVSQAAPFSSSSSLISSCACSAMMMMMMAAAS
jgi:Na+/glutamate symporter